MEDKSCNGPLLDNTNIVIACSNAALVFPPRCILISAIASVEMYVSIGCFSTEHGAHVFSKWITIRVPTVRGGAARCKRKITWSRKSMQTKLRHS